MPGYNTHRAFNYAAFAVVAVFVAVREPSVFDPVKFIILIGGFYAGTEFITPDLDIESKAVKRWGSLSALWLPYRILFRHGQSSHNIVYGAAVRLLYISAVILGIYFLLFRALPPDIMFLPFEYVVFFIGGIMMANALHVMLDMLF